jgi:hypothetical protein
MLSHEHRLNVYINSMMQWRLAVQDLKEEIAGAKTNLEKAWTSKPEDWDVPHWDLIERQRLNPSPFPAHIRQQRLKNGSGNCEND